jgi:hypothetical protein
MLEIADSALKSCHLQESPATPISAIPARGRIPDQKDLTGLQTSGLLKVEPTVSQTAAIPHLTCSYVAGC